MNELLTCVQTLNVLKSPEHKNFLVLNDLRVPTVCLCEFRSSVFLSVITLPQICEPPIQEMIHKRVPSVVEILVLLLQIAQPFSHHNYLFFGILELLLKIFLLFEALSQPLLHQIEN